MYELNFKDAFSLHNSLDIYVNRDTAILKMIETIDKITIAGFWDQELIAVFWDQEVFTQKQYHDLDGYVVNIDVFVNGVYKGGVELITKRIVKK